MQKKTNEKKTNVQKGVDWYRKEIIKMLNQIKNKSHIKMIYGFVKKIYENK